jgi:hypothetical protein
LQPIFAIDEPMHRHPQSPKLQDSKATSVNAESVSDTSISRSFHTGWPQCGPCPITKQRPLGSLAKWPQRLDLLTLTPGTGAFGDPVMEVGPADDRFDPYPRQAASPSAQNLAQLTVGSCI